MMTSVVTISVVMMISTMTSKRGTIFAQEERCPRCFKGRERKIRNAKGRKKTNENNKHKLHFGE